MGRVCREEMRVLIHMKYWESLQQSLREYQLSIQDIDQIILTHHHGDRIGNVNTILAQKEMPIFADRSGDS